VVEILAKAASAHRFGQIAVGGRHDAHVDLDGARAAHALEAALLQHAQQLGLQLGFELADLVEKQGSPIGQLEATAMVRHGAREGPLFVPEHLAFEERLRDGRAVDGDERPCGPPAFAVQARDSTSLPVPLSPSSSTVASVAATFRTCPMTACMARSLATMDGSPLSGGACAGRLRASGGAPSRGWRPGEARRAPTAACRDSRRLPASWPRRRPPRFRAR
jgi:hypothetical protein